jgi:hypothetical protein
MQRLAVGPPIPSHPPPLLADTRVPQLKLHWRALTGGATSPSGRKATVIG